MVYLQVLGFAWVKLFHFMAEFLFLKTAKQGNCYFEKKRIDPFLIPLLLNAFSSCFFFFKPEAAATLVRLGELHIASAETLAAACIFASWMPGEPLNLL